MAVNQKLRERLKDHIEKRGIDPLDERNDLPVELIHADKVPVIGSVHLSMGRTVSRKKIDKLFSRAKFS